MNASTRTRREFLRGLAGAALAGAAGAPRAQGGDSSPSPPSSGPLPASAYRAIPSSGASVPRIGMGTWITFDLEPGTPGTERRVAVLREFFARGGGVIDSSPMYGAAEAMLGHALARAPHAPEALFGASKIWTPIDSMAGVQMANTEALWGTAPMDLMQVHNLVDVAAHLPRLREWKAEGRIGHVGLTTSHGRRHDELEALLRTEEVDTVQLTLNLRRREAEARLLPLAADRGVAVIANRPLERGALPAALASRPLSPLAAELGCTSWAQFCLLYATSHPAVTCAIPATSDPAHMTENMAVLDLEVPDAATRAAMAREIA